VNAPDETRNVEQLMREWDALRVTESYRRVTFTSQRDEVVARWSAYGPHGVAESDFVAFRLSRGEMALREILELEVHSDVLFAKCRADLEGLSPLGSRDRQRSLASIRDTCVDAVRVNMRYRHSLVTTFQHEVTELAVYIEDRLEAAG
jgi:hypothetical protein